MQKHEEDYPSLQELDPGPQHREPGKTMDDYMWEIVLNHATNNGEIHPAVGYTYPVQGTKKLWCVACKSYFYDAPELERRTLHCPHCGVSWFEEPVGKSARRDYGSKDPLVALYL